MIGVRSPFFWKWVIKLANPLKFSVGWTIFFVRCVLSNIFCFQRLCKKSLLGLRVTFTYRTYLWATCYNYERVKWPLKNREYFLVSIKFWKLWKKGLIELKRSLPGATEWGHSFAVSFQICDYAAFNYRPGVWCWVTL